MKTYLETHGTAAPDVEWTLITWGERPEIGLRRSKRLRFGDIIEVNGKVYEVRIISDQSKYCTIFSEDSFMKNFPANPSKFPLDRLKKMQFAVIKFAE